MDQQVQSPPAAPPQQLTPDQTRVYNEAWQTATSLHQGGVQPAAIYDIIVKKGVDPASAQQMVNNVTSIPANNRRSEGQRDMLIGALWLVGGIVITVGTYMAVSESGGRYLITYGPIIYGLIRFFKGVSKL